MPEPSMVTRINNLYKAFNRRDGSFVIDQMSPNVKWPRAFEGDFVTGQDAVRTYWEHQWQEIDPHVEPQSIDELPDGRLDVTIHQVVKDLSGNVLADDIVHHFYEFDDGLIASMEVNVPRINLGLER